MGKLEADSVMAHLSTACTIWVRVSGRVGYLGRVREAVRLPLYDHENMTTNTSQEAIRSLLEKALDGVKGELCPSINPIMLSITAPAPPACPSYIFCCMYVTCAKEHKVEHDFFFYYFHVSLFILL